MAHLSVHIRWCKLAASMPHSLSHREKKKSSYLSDDFYYWVVSCLHWYTDVFCVWSVHMLVTAAEQNILAVLSFLRAPSSCGIFMVRTVHSSYFNFFQGIEISVCPFFSQKVHDGNALVRSYICSGVHVPSAVIFKTSYTSFPFFFISSQVHIRLVFFFFKPSPPFFFLFLRCLSPCMNLGRCHPCKVALI